MILLAIILFVVGYFIFRPLLWTAAGVLLILGLAFILLNVGEYGGWPVYHGG